MSLLLLLRAELLKLRASKVFVVTAVVMIICSTAWPIYCASMLAFSSQDYCASSALPWPNSALGAIAVVDALVVPLSALIFSWLLGSEFSRDTWKMTLPRQASRSPFVLIKLVAAGLALAAITAGGVLGWSGSALLLAPMVGINSQSTEVAAGPIDLLPQLQPQSSTELHISQSAAGLQLRTLEPSFPTAETEVLELGAGLRARVPRTLAANSQGSLPRSSSLPAELRLFSPLQRETRMAAVLQAWAAVQTFHPWVADEVPQPDAVLITALQHSAAQTSGTQSLKLLYAPLRDGHAMALHPMELAQRRLPWLWRSTGSDLVITVVAPTGGGGAMPGDRVVGWNGVPFEQVWEQQLRFTTGGTEGSRRKLATTMLSRGPSGQLIEVELESPAGERRTVMVSYSQPSGSLSTAKSKALNRLAPTTWYVDPSRLRSSEWTAALPKLLQAEQIIIDLRSHPGAFSKDFLRNLSPEALRSDQFSIPLWQSPGVVGSWSKTQWLLKPKTEQINAKLAFLSDDLSLSYAESLLAVVAQNELGIIVGSTTMGANGNVAKHRLVGGYRVQWTGMEVLGPDGQSRNRAGIQPTHAVQPTAAGIGAGRDEVLEAALELLKE